FEYSGGKWSYSPRIYDIRKAEPGVEERFVRYETSPAPKAERPDAASTSPSDAARPAANATATLPAPIQKLINDMVFVQGGTFTMGCTAEQGSDCYDDEKPAHRVKVSSFKIGKYEVTQAQWRAVMGSDPPGLYNTGCDQCPVEGVSYYDIVNSFIPKLNSITGQSFRLPTEAEWEYAARGGSQSRGYKYSGSNILDDVGWYFSNYESGNTYGSEKTTRPVGSKQPNELGIYDMSGNVWEWCSDWYGQSYYNNSPAENPRGPASGEFRVVRGGSWYINPSYCRVALRLRCSPGYCNYYYGFRIAQDF
ncbi:MAG: formylglycine-generating enzyme family protein, partial [Chitinophagales bacterium]|nr:formylglycine-generating enzyme family protein [Chitinophagales bacterium]